MRIAAFLFVLIGWGAQSCGHHDVTPASGKSIPKADTVIAECLSCVCYKGGTCCEIIGDTIVVPGNRFTYRYEHNKTKSDSVSWSILSGDAAAVTIQSSDSVATILFMPNFTSCVLHAYGRGDGWLCEDILRIRK